MSPPLEGVAALVTGGGSGIGRAIALRLARDGASTAILGRRREALAETRALADGENMSAFVLDVCDRAAVDEVVAEAVAALGGVDVLVNNAGVGGPNACALAGEDRWREIIATNLDGVFYVTRAALRSMSDGGSVVNVSSVLGKFGVPGYTAYCTSKHGIVGFTRSLALEVAPRRIRVNAVCPGWVETEMARAGFRDIARASGQSEGEARSGALAQVPLGRVLEPDEIAGLVAWLVSSEARGMTGQAVNLSGGSAVW